MLVCKLGTYHYYAACYQASGTADLGHGDEDRLEGAMLWILCLKIIHRKVAERGGKVSQVHSQHECRSYWISLKGRI